MQAQPSIRLPDTSTTPTANNQLSGVGLQYDADGQRVAKGSIITMSCDPTTNGFQVTEECVLGPSGQQLTEMGSDGNGNLVWQRTYVEAAGQTIAAYDPTGLHFRLTDWLGSLRATTDYAGVREGTCTSLPYGDGQNCSDSTDPHFFTGKERDTESGLDYFGARYYGSTMGRFSSPDPSGLFYADPTNPQSLNLYAYVQNNPLVNVDPDGLDCIYTSNLTSTSVSVETVRGDCRSDSDNGVFVNGTVNTDSYKAQVGSDGDVHLGFGYTSDDDSGGSSNGGYTLTANAGSTDIGPAVQDMFSMSQDARISALAQGVTADSQHSFGCIAQAYGIGAPSAATGQAGSNLFNASQNLVGKARFGGALGGSTAYTSEAAMAARASSWGGIPFRVPTPVGTPFTGNFAMRSSSTLGGAAGRYAPYAGAAGKALGAAGVAYSSYKLWNCL